VKLIDLCIVLDSNGSSTFKKEITMKSVLKIFIILQTTFVFTACLNQLSQVLSDDGTINKYGYQILKHIDVDITKTKYFNVFQTYGVCTGTIRGYSFFSPNVERFDRKFNFVSENGEILKPKMRYFESSFKFNCLQFSLFRELVGSADRDAYLRTMSAHLMSHNSLDCIDVYLSTNSYNDIENAKADYNNALCSSEEIHLFTIRKKIKA